MWCEQREHLLSEYRNVMAELTVLAIRDGQAADQSSAGTDTQVNGALATIARADLREHVEEHGCWSHAVYSSLFFLWRNQWTDATKALDEPSKVASKPSLASANEFLATDSTALRGSPQSGHPWSPKIRPSKKTDFSRAATLIPYSEEGIS